MKISNFLFVLLLASLGLTGHVFADNLQDSTLNNLVYPPGYRCCEVGTLGKVLIAGTGKRSLILVSGLGFGGEIYEDFISRYQEEFTIYVVTPPGFDSTPAPTLPDSSHLTGQGWNDGIVTGILGLIDQYHLTAPDIVASFVTGTQVALNLAIDHSDRIGSVVVLGGSPYRYYPNQKADGTWSDWSHEKVLTPAQRSKVTEVYWGPKWFRTVTKKTWDDNMWTPSDYCKDPTKGLELFDTSARVPLPVMIHYLIEWMTYDRSASYKNIQSRTLVLLPDFKGILPPAGADSESVCLKTYLRYYHQENWKQLADAHNPHVTIDTIPDSRLFVWYDNPTQTFSRLDAFLHAKK